MTEEILAHYSEKPLGRIGSRAQKAQPEMKPVGFWVSVDSCEETWPKWCRAEGFAVEALAVRTRVFLHADAKILRMGTAADLDAFTTEYRHKASLESLCWIDWARVAEKHQGLIIAPYVWQRRLTHGFLWYYGWDCASGCIWDARAIADLVQTAAPA